MSRPMRKLLLITASSPEIMRVRRARVLNFQQITMPYLAAFVPPGWDVVHVDEAVTPVDVTAPADVVAITFHTPSAPHVYELARQFRSRGVLVALGGPHVTLMPDEAAEHADVIFVGEAEQTWPAFLRDVESGRPAPRYQPETPPLLEQVPMACKEHYHRRDLTAGRLFATRGCAFDCEFCALVPMYQRCVRRRPVAEVAAEFASFKGKVIIFWDDNLANDLDYARDLCRAIEPHRKWWSSQASLHAGRDEAFLEHAARSGCKQLFLGLESVSQASMNGVGKRFNRVDDYARIIERIHAHGIAVQAGIVFGFDHDTESVFDETTAFLEAVGVQNATFNILTPYPGTRLFRRLEAEGRILTRDWARYNGRDAVVYQPKLMSADALLDGYRRAYQRFYSAGSIARRLARSPVGLWWTLPLNVAYAAAAWREASAASR